MKLSQMKDQAADLAKEYSAIVETAENDGDRSFSDEERGRMAEISVESSRIHEKMDAAETAAALSLKMARPIEDASLAGIVAMEGDGRDAETIKNQAGVLQQLQEMAEAAPRPFKTFGEQLEAIYRAETYRDVDPRLLGVVDQQAAATGANEAVDSEGGFLVQGDFAAGILRNMIEGGEILSRVRRIPISANSNRITLFTHDETSRATGSRLGGVQGYWVDQGTAPTASQPKFGKLELGLNKVAALGYATEELLQDSTAMSGIFQDAFAEELRFLVEDSVINGTGAGQPLGILNSDAEIAIAKETGQAATTYLFENNSKQYTRMWAPSRANAVWLINQDTESVMEQMALVIGTGGVPVYLPAGGVSVNGFASLRGRPVIPVEYCSTLGTVGDVILADLSQYLMIDKGGVQQSSSIHVRFTQGETAFRAIYRVDGQPAWKSALTPFKGSNTLSPFVTVATRS
jgi:HK97 family phage major capsid protein